MEITEFDKQILSGIKENKIYNEFSFILQFIEYEIEENGDGYKYYYIENSESALIKYTRFIQLIGYLEEQKMIKIIKANTSNDSIIIKHKTESEYSKNFNNYRLVYQNQSIIKFISLDHYIENSYLTDSQIEFAFNQKKYLSEKRDRIISQRITITVAMISMITSVLVSIGVFSKKEKNNTNIDHNFYLNLNHNIVRDSLNSHIKQKLLFKVYLDSINITKTSN